MKIYFTAAISQKNQFGSYYQRIVDYLEKNDNKVQHEHINNKTMKMISEQNDNELEDYYNQVLKWITAADLVVVEASFPSTLNIGHEVSVALDKGKPVIALYKKGFSSFFLNGIRSDRLLLIEYEDKNLEEMLEESIEYAKDQSDTRFNFFISPRHANYLDWISKYKKIPRSVYLRNLIKHDMQHNKEYLAA